MEIVDCVVIGAGVIGLAIARAIARRGIETVVIDAQRHIGCGESSRNSEVIHAGIYYPRGSLKSRLCVTGRATLYAYCETHGVAYRRCGKLLVATTPDETGPLEELLDSGKAAGVEDLVLLTGAQARRLEPDLHCVAALESPSTGVIDSHAYMIALQGEAEAAGATFVFDTTASRLSCRARTVELTLMGERQPALRTRLLINSAGLDAQNLARTLPELDARHVPPIFYAKGNYFSLSRRCPFRRLIYPLPRMGGLGVHLTLDLDGRARFGPDTEWVDTPNYRVDPQKSMAFYDAIRTYWPGIQPDWLMPGYAGVRAKLSAPGAGTADFVISTPVDHGVAGLINLFGIESPGLTSSLSIGEHVAALGHEILES